MFNVKTYEAPRFNVQKTLLQSSLITSLKLTGVVLELIAYPVYIISRSPDGYAP